MELYVDSEVGGAVDAAERAVIEHLRRHAELDELVELAEPMVRAAVREPLAPARWLSLDWSERAARLSVTQLPEPPPPDVVLEELEPGLALAQDAVGPLRSLADAAGAGSVQIELPVVRAAEATIDPVPVALPASAVEGRDSFFAAATNLLAGPAVSGRSEAERAALLGASLAGAVAGTAERGRTAAEAAAAYVELQHRLGGDFFVIEADDRRAVLGNRRCPFAVDGTPPTMAMCRFSSALAGRIAAGDGQDAHVVVDERIAAGDHRCRIEIDLDAPEEAQGGHRYGANPAGLADLDTDDAQITTRGLRVSLSLLLPRDKLSVVLARRLARHALIEAGAIPEHADDVELALAEAAANVIDHAGPGDIYEVSVEVRPETCELRVVDVGRGFDHLTLSQEMANVTAEEGRGIALMHALMDQVRFDAHPEQGTIVHLVKRLAFDDRSPVRALMLGELGPVADDAGD